MANGNNITNAGTGYRNIIALAALISSISGVLALSGIVIWKSTDTDKTSQMVLTAVLPLLGSWVGTILVYYFSKENFEAATRSVTQMVEKLTPQEKLQSTPVKDKMIPKDKMFYKKLPANQINLFGTLDELASKKMGNRIPLLDEKDYPKYVIHRSTIDKFLAEKARSTTPTDMKILTLQDILSDADLGKTLETSFVTVREDSNLADAKDAMDRTPDCQDVFITKGGTKNEEVKGWLTNVMIAENAKV